MAKYVLTNYRKEVLDIIENNDKPISAKEILCKIKSNPNFSTIYRALEYLEKSGNINGIYFSENTKYYFGRKEHSHFIFCEVCNEFKKFKICFAGEIQNKLEESYNYKIKSHSFHFSGICEKCK